MSILEDRRCWLITSTTYGSWLPGDSRGFVSNVRVPNQPREVRHNRLGEEYDRNLPRLKKHVRKRLQTPPVSLSQRQAIVLLRQFQETCDYRRWLLLSAAVMQTHFHAVISVEGDPDPEILLRDLKSYGSRALNRDAGTPSGTDWWTESGSKRKLPNLEAVLAGVRYVQQQPGALVIHTANFPEFEEFNGERGASAP